MQSNSRPERELFELLAVLFVDDCCLRVIFVEYRKHIYCFGNNLSLPRNKEYF